MCEEVWAGMWGGLRKTRGVPKSGTSRAGAGAGATAVGVNLGINLNF